MDHIQCIALTRAGRQCHKNSNTPEGDPERRICYCHLRANTITVAKPEQESPVTRCIAITQKNKQCLIACEDAGGDPENQLCRIHCRIARHTASPSKPVKPPKQPKPVKRSLLPQLNITHIPIAKRNDCALRCVTAAQLSVENTPGTSKDKRSVWIRLYRKYNPEYASGALCVAMNCTEPATCGAHVNLSDTAGQFIAPFCQGHNMTKHGKAGKQRQTVFQPAGYIMLKPNTVLLEISPI